MVTAGVGVGEEVTAGVGVVEESQKEVEGWVVVVVEARRTTAEVD